MGHSAKLTRGGNKKRVNVGRQEAKAREYAAKASKEEGGSAMASKPSAAGKSQTARQALSAQLKKVAKTQNVIKMAAKPKAPAAAAAQAEK